MFKSGYVSIVGKPNAGKSTLLNKLVGFKVAITTPKPQTTRFNIKGIVTSKTSQIVFIDTVSLVFCDALVREGLMLFLLFHLMLRLRLMFL